MTPPSSTPQSIKSTLAERVRSRVEAEGGCPRCMRYSLVDVHAAAERLGTTPRHVRGLVSQRLIPFVKVGRLVRFNQVDLDLWIVAHTRQAVNVQRGWRQP